MSEEKHTPGPWNPAEIQTVNVLPFVPVVATTLIAKVYSTAFGDHEQAIANARLMSCAPELLEALKELDECYCQAGQELTREDRHHHRLTLMKARAAIAKATGAPT